MTAFINLELQQFEMDVHWPWLDAAKVSHLYEEDSLKDDVEDQRIGCECINVHWG